MKRTSPLVSIGMPVLNAEATLSLAIDSILAQSLQDWELLIMDDGSTDRSMEIARSYADGRIRICEDGRSLGIAYRMNQAVRLGRGRFFARMDADDIAYPERLRLQSEYMDAHPEVDLVGGWVLVVDREERPIGIRRFPEQHAQIRRQLWTGIPMAHPTFFGRMDWFRRNPYDVSFKKAQDQELLRRTCENSRFANVQCPVLAYREGALSLKQSISRRWFVIKGAARGLVHLHQVNGVGVMLGQLSKIMVEAFLSLFGLRQKALSAYRNAMPDSDEMAEWRSVLQALPGKERRV